MISFGVDGLESRTYRVILAGSTFLPRQHLSVDIRNHCLSIHNHRLGIRDRHVRIDYQLGLNGGCKVRKSLAELIERTIKT